MTVLVTSLLGEKRKAGVGGSWVWDFADLMRMPAKKVKKLFGGLTTGYISPVTLPRVQCAITNAPNNQ